MAKVKDIVNLITAPTEIMSRDDDGNPCILYSIYSPEDLDTVPANIAEMEIESIDHGREAIVINV